MNLKEAFRHQNYLSGLMSTIQSGFSEKENFVTKTQHHLHSKAMTNKSDEVLVVPTQPRYSGMIIFKCTPDQIIELYLNIAEEKERLTQAIGLAKKNSAYDIDTLVQNNAMKRNVLEALTRASMIKDEEKILKENGYTFNNEGNQVPYVYEIKENTNANYDRVKLKSIMKVLNEECDKNSTLIEELHLEVKVDYVPHCNYNLINTLEDLIEETYLLKI